MRMALHTRVHVFTQDDVWVLGKVCKSAPDTELSTFLMCIGTFDFILNIIVTY